MSNFSAADVPAVAKKAIINGVEKGETFLATVLAAIVDLSRTHTDILVDGSESQKETWRKYLPEIELAVILDGVLYAQVVEDVYTEYAKQELVQAVNEYLAANVSPDEEVVEWRLEIDNGTDEPFVVTNNDGTVGLIPVQTGVALTDLPEPGGSGVGSDGTNENELAELEEEQTLRTTETLPAAFDVEAAADNVVPSVIPDNTPAQPKWPC